MRYDWNVYKDQRALIEHAATWALAVMAVVAIPVFLWLAVAWYWPMALAPAPLAVAAVASRMALRGHYGIREAQPAEPRQQHAARVPLRKSIVLPPAAWPACDVSTVLDRSGRYNGSITIEDASGKPGGTAPVIRAVPCDAVRDIAGRRPVVTAWTITVRSADPEEAARRLDAAEPLLLAHLARASGDGARYFRLDGGRLREVADDVRVIVQPGGRLAAWSDRAQSEVLAPGWRPMRRSPGPAVARPDSGAVKLDPRWEWKLVRSFGIPDRYVKVRCLHTEVEPVPSLAGEVVAQLCLTCDTQFPAPREN